MKLNSVERNALETVQRSCKIANIKITKSGLQDKLLQHPHFPSMQALKDTFTSFNVPNLAVRIEPLLLEKIATPLIVYMDSSLGYGTVEKVESGFVEWFHNDLGAFREHISDFSRKWQGVSLVIEPNRLSGDAHYKKNRFLEIYGKLRKPFGWTAAALLLATWLIADQRITSWTFDLLLMIQIAGVLLSVRLIQISMDKYDSFWRKGRDLNFPTATEAILRSELAKTSIGINWPELSLLCFSGSFLFLIISNQIDHVIGPLKLLNYFAIASTFWLVYVQFKLKSWSLLCVIILSLIWIEFLIFFNWTIILFSNWNDIKGFVISFFIPIIVWMFVKRPIQSVSLAQGHYYTIKKMMYDPIYLQSIRSDRKNLPSFFTGMNGITIGKPSADDCITLVLNPICYMCRNAYFQTQKLVSENPGIKCEIILAVSPNSQSIDNIVTYTILGSESGEEANVLDDWYRCMPVKLEDWRATRRFDLARGLDQLTHHLRWYELAGLKSELPVTILNGAELPAIYNASDIKRILSIRFDKEYTS